MSAGDALPGSDPAATRDTGEPGPDAAGEIRALYEAEPYPARGALNKVSGAPRAPVRWINEVARPGRPVLAPGTRALVAGCGAGGEAHRYARDCPGTEVVGVDFSPASIEVARRLMLQEGHKNLRFEVADLTKDDLADRFAPFDYISLWGVIDYIPEPEAAFRTLARALAPGGCIYAGVNGPGHMSVRVRQALPAHGIEPGRTTVDDATRDKLRTIEALMGPDWPGTFSESSQIYILGDILAPLNHSYPLDRWVAIARAAGLHLVTSPDLVSLIPRYPTRILRNLFHLSRGELYLLVAALRPKGFMRMLLAGAPPVEAPFADLDALDRWVPRLVEGLREAFPPPGSGPEAAAAVTIRAPGMRPDVAVAPEHAAFLRACDGRRSVAEARAEAGGPADVSALRTALFRLFHLGVLHLAPPPDG